MAGTRIFVGLPFIIVVPLAAFYVAGLILFTVFYAIPAHVVNGIVKMHRARVARKLAKETWWHYKSEPIDGNR